MAPTQRRTSAANPPPTSSPTPLFPPWKQQSPSRFCGHTLVMAPCRGTALLCPPRRKARLCPHKPGSLRKGYLKTAKPPKYCKFQIFIVLAFCHFSCQHFSRNGESPSKAFFMQRTRYPERRRTVRLPLQIPVKVRCRLPEGETIDLQASTYVVSAHGALLLMDTPLIPGQSVRIFNEMTAESAECHVTSLREK